MVVKWWWCSYSTCSCADCTCCLPLYAAVCCRGGFLLSFVSANHQYNLCAHISQYLRHTLHTRLRSWLARAYHYYPDGGRAWLALLLLLSEIRAIRRVYFTLLYSTSLQSSHTVATHAFTQRLACSERCPSDYVLVVLVMQGQPALGGRCCDGQCLIFVLLVLVHAVDDCLAVVVRYGLA